MGIAWSATQEIRQINTVNVAVGLNVNDNQKVVDELQSEVDILKNQIAETNSMLEKLVAGFKAPGSSAQPASEKNTAQVTSPTTQSINGNTLMVPDETNIVYHELTKEQILQGVELAEKLMRDKGIDIDTHPFWIKYKADPSYKENVVTKIQSKLRDGFSDSQKINKRK